jgi:hypothetical protein
MYPGNRRARPTAASEVGRGSADSPGGCRRTSLSACGASRARRRSTSWMRSAAKAARSSRRAERRSETSERSNTTRFSNSWTRRRPNTRCPSSRQEENTADGVLSIGMQAGKRPRPHGREEAPPSLLPRGTGERARPAAQRWPVRLSAKRGNGMGLRGEYSPEGNGGGGNRTRRPGRLSSPCPAPATPVVPSRGVEPRSLALQASAITRPARSARLNGVCPVAGPRLAMPGAPPLLHRYFALRRALSRESDRTHRSAWRHPTVRTQACSDPVARGPWWGASSSGRVGGREFTRGPGGRWDGGRRRGGARTSAQHASASR